MSGMFQRIARRQADHSDEPPADHAAEPVAETPAVEQPATPDAPADEGQATSELVVDDRPTERIEVVSPPAEVPAASDPPTTPPPTIDLTARLAPVEPAAQPDATRAGTQPPAAAPATDPGTAQTAVATPAQRRPGFRARGRMRRRLRYLRKLRDLQVRDLGGLVFDLRRFERTRDDLIAAKIDQIRACDDELRALERALDERRDLRDVREPGIGGTCPRCFAIYGSADKFCANCGAAFGGAVQGPAAQVPLTSPTAPETSGSGSQA